jgi:hypothetical protein
MHWRRLWRITTVLLVMSAGLAFADTPLANDGRHIYDRPLKIESSGNDGRHIYDRPLTSQLLTVEEALFLVWVVFPTWMPPYWQASQAVVGGIAFGS